MLGFGDYCSRIAQCFDALKDHAADCERAASILVDALKNGNKVIFCGNGGSAADSQHLAAELMGRFLFDRNPLPALALTVDTSSLTAIGNDYGYGCVFSRQLKGIGKAGDVLVGISTSGNSQNVVDAIRVAQEMDIATIGLTGAKGGRMADVCDVCLRVPSDATNHIQEMHIAVGHWLCGVVEERMCKPESEENVTGAVRAA